MRKRRADVQRIEIVTVDDPSWWGETPADPLFVVTPSSKQPPRRHRIVVVALVVALAAAATAFIVFKDDDEATPTRVGAGHYIIDSPALRPYSADIVTPLSNRASYTLFTNGNPTNPWLSLQVARAQPAPAALMDSYRREVDGRNLVTPRNERSQTTIFVDLPDGWTVAVRAFDINDRELVRFVDSLMLTDAVTGAIAYEHELLSANSLTPTRTATWADELLYGRVSTEMRAVTTEGTIITLRESRGSADTRPSSLAYFSTGRVEGSDGYTAETLTANRDAIVTWAVDGRLLSLTGAVSTTDLLAIARTVRQANATEWTELLYGLHPDYRLEDFARGNAGTAADGTTWSSGVQLADRGSRTEFLWWWTLPGTTDSASAPSRTALTAAGNETIVVGSITYVYVWVPADSSATLASVRATDGTHFELELQPLFAGVPVRFAMTRIDASGPVEVSTS